MPQRQTQAKAIQAFTTVAGVNQRQLAVDIPPQDWSDLMGVWPEFAGLQSHLPGKLLLAKYNFPIYGIYQFWTPWGYAQGVYQFSGSVDVAPWLTQPTQFNLPTLPAQLPFDINYYTVDEFGFTNYSFFELLPPAVPAPAPVNANNGGGAGQGKNCQYTVVTNTIPTVATNYLIGTDGVTYPLISEGALPYPYPIAHFATEPATYIPGQGQYNSNLVATYTASTSKIDEGLAGWRVFQSWSSYSQKATLDFTAALALGTPISVQLNFSRGANAPFTFFSVLIDVTWEPDANGNPPNFNNYPFNPYDYVQTLPPVANATGGYTQTDFINMIGVTVQNVNYVCN